MEYDKILKYQYAKDRFEYRIGLRNEKKFNMHDDVFIAYNNHDIVAGKIVGIMISASENPDYIYTISVPDAWVYENISEKHRDRFFSEEIKEYVMSASCDRLFTNAIEAKQSAINRMNHLFELQKQEIDRYFEKFGITPD